MFTTILIFAIIAAMVASEIVLLFTPLVVFGVTELVKRVLPKIQGWQIVLVLVPALSIGIAFFADLLSNPLLSFWYQVAYGLVGVFLNELFRQLKLKE